MLSIHYNMFDRSFKSPLNCRSLPILLSLFFLDIYLLKRPSSICGGGSCRVSQSGSCWHTTIFKSELIAKSTPQILFKDLENGLFLSNYVIFLFFPPCFLNSFILITSESITKSSIKLPSAFPWGLYLKTNFPQLNSNWIRALKPRIPH